MLAWCRDARNTWESELQRGERPEVLRGVEVDFGAALAGRKKAKARIYDPWTGKWSGGNVRNGKVKVPAFSRSVVIRVE